MTPMSVSAPAVVVHDLFVERGRRTVLPSLSVDVPTGVVTGLLGPSGCGKTTLLRAIVGVQRVAGGSVTVLCRPEHRSCGSALRT
jgi:ABC-2 type transport system ATP-binding protein